MYLSMLHKDLIVLFISHMSGRFYYHDSANSPTRMHIVAIFFYLYKLNIYYNFHTQLEKTSEHMLILYGCLVIILFIFYNYKSP